jgi:molybdenum cofactor cytidylyltransferase
MPEVAPAPRGPLRLGAVIMAAGGSRRMGSTKQLLELEGRPLVVRAVDAMLRAEVRPVVVVLGAHAEDVRASLNGLPVLTVLNTDWGSGLASSIRMGVAAVLEADPAVEAVLLAPCDQPALSPAIVQDLAALFRRSGHIAAARFGGRNGAPAVFGRPYFAELCALQGDEGARRILNASNDVATLDLPELATDLDTPDDLLRWEARTR